MTIRYVPVGTVVALVEEGRLQYLFAVQLTEDAQPEVISMYYHFGSYTYQVAYLQWVYVERKKRDYFRNARPDAAVRNLDTSMKLRLKAHMDTIQQRQAVPADALQAWNAILTQLQARPKVIFRTLEDAP